MICVPCRVPVVQLMTTAVLPLNRWEESGGHYWLRFHCGGTGMDVVGRLSRPAWAVFFVDGVWCFRWIVDEPVMKFVFYAGRLRRG